ncbi:hypothetical protein Poli38472_003248 [Pythium oligandrum]|uniref:WW domain-containing protein n=1 Tax=Pythium oligandrum TaxID=41045 RepID=A0A8K1C6T0_PYTOL|nr:hypothetical protein Poli38472_003248 [Pythium oligandrum]|eukprot:TMW57323.1 hypothetical protein Poli38472_003248 [Pythium oligandrum]
MAFAYGILSPIERNLEQFLLSIYDAQASVDFKDIHNVNSIVDIVKLFPVLLFPCLWTQRVIKRRVLGEVTWERLRDRRVKLQNAGLTNLFVSSTEIVVALASTTRSKSKHIAKFEKNTVKETTNDVYPLSGSTPRKILPVESPMSLQNRQFGNESGTWAILGTYRTADDAWRVTADSALATAYCASESLRHQDSNLTLDDLRSTFERMRIELEQRTCSQPKCETTRQFLVQAYGYQFATFLFEKSSLAREALVPTAPLGIGARKQTLRAKLRYEKAWYGGKLVEDKAVYWKEYTDPVLKRVFYHNIRTGESRWEQPSTFEPPKPKRTRKRRQTPDVL